MTLKHNTLDGDVEFSEEYLARVYSPEALRMSEIEWLRYAERVRDELLAKQNKHAR